MVFRKYFTNSKNIPEINLELATNWLNDIIDNKIDNTNINKYNRDSNLPKNIYQIIENDKLVGYKVNIMIDGKKYSKSFQSNTTLIEELLQKAIKYKESILNSYN
jgi:hypothetical protein